jgi:hypothetical protein
MANPEAMPRRVVPDVERAHQAEPPGHRHGEGTPRVPYGEGGQDREREEQVDAEAIRVVVPVPDVIHGEERRRAEHGGDPQQYRAVAVDPPGNHRRQQVAEEERSRFGRLTAVVWTWLQAYCTARAAARVPGQHQHVGHGDRAGGQVRPQVEALAGIGGEGGDERRGAETDQPTKGITGRVATRSRNTEATTPSAVTHATKRRSAAAPPRSRDQVGELRGRRDSRT